MTDCDRGSTPQTRTYEANLNSTQMLAMVPHNRMLLWRSPSDPENRSFMLLLRRLDDTTVVPPRHPKQNHHVECARLRLTVTQDEIRIGQVKEGLDPGPV